MGFVRSLCVADFSERLETELLSAQEQSIGLSSVKVLSCDLTILCETRPLFLESSEGYQGQLFSRRVLFGFKKNTMVLQNSLVLKTYEVLGINKP